MKMIRAILRPDTADVVADWLLEAGYNSMTKINGFGRGKQKGLTVGEMHYDELPKTILIVVIEDESVNEVVKIINEKAFTGNFGDGKIFITSVEEVITVRTGASGL